MSAKEIRTILEAFKTIESLPLNEDLGNLHDLGLEKNPKLLMIFKQSVSSNPKGRHHVSWVGKKFSDSVRFLPIGRDSEIIDGGPMKFGLKDIRKVYKAHESAVGFVVYIKNMPVAIGIIKNRNIGKTTYPNAFGYDLTPFEKDFNHIRSKIDQENAGKKEWQHKKSYPQLTSYQQRDEQNYDIHMDQRNDSNRTIKREYFAKALSTVEINEHLQLVIDLANSMNVTPTFKVILDSSDVVYAMRRKRMNNREIRSPSQIASDNLKNPDKVLDLARVPDIIDLRKRLSDFKNSKFPTVTSIKDFVGAVEKNIAQKIRINGRTFYSTLRTTMSSNDTLSVASLLNEKPITVTYSTADPDRYDSLKLEYVYSKQTRTLTPYFGTIDSYKEILDPKMYLFAQYRVKDLAKDKDKILSQLVGYLKKNQTYYLDEQLPFVKKCLELLGVEEWPELAVIEKGTRALKSEK